MKNIPALDPKVLGLVTEISKEPKVEAAIAFIKDQTEVAMLEQIELCEIEAPTFHEEKSRFCCRAYEAVRFDRCSY